MCHRTRTGRVSRDNPHSDALPRKVTSHSGRVTVDGLELEGKLGHTAVGQSIDGTTPTVSLRLNPKEIPALF